MEVTDFFFELIESGLQLRVENGGLCYRGARGALTPERRETLQKSKDAIIALLQPETEYLPLSYQQQRLWLLYHWDPESPFYNMPAAAHLRGRLDSAALARAFHELACRHQALRTTFPMLDGRPVQAVSAAPAEYSALPVHDLRAVPEAEREAEASRLIEAEARRPFDVRNGPLWRISLLQTGDEDYVMLMTMHHIISDGWSLRILFREIGKLYAGFVRGESSPLAPLAPGYGDFTLWQRQWMQGESCHAQLEYWKNQLPSGSDFPRLPTDYPRPALPTYQGHTIFTHISPETTAAIKSISAGEGATLFMALLAAFQIVQGQYTKSDDVRVGSAIANRNRSQTEETVGFFVNTLTLRTNLADNPTFRDVLRRVRATALGAYAHQDVPFEKIVDLLKPRRDGETVRQRQQTRPMFQVFFLLQNVPSHPLQLPGLTLQFQQSTTGTAKFELALSLSEENDGLTAKWEFNTDLFETATIEKLSAHYGRILQVVASAPDTHLAALPQAHAENTGFIEEELPVQNITRQAYLAPRDELEKRIAEVWHRLLGVEKIGVRDDFFDAGGHSLLAIRLLDEAEKITGQRLSLAMFFQAPTIEGQAAVLRSTATPKSPSLVPLQPLGTRPPLFCVDGAVRYRALAAHMAPDQPVYGLIPENPTGGQWYSFSRVGERASHYIDVVRSVQPHGPYYFAGLSFAGQIAIIMAQRLRAQGEEVRLMALFDTYGPGYFTMPFSRRVALHFRALKNLDATARAQYLRDRARKRLLKKNDEHAEPAPVIAPPQEVPEDEWQVDVFARELSPEEMRHLRAMAYRMRRNPETARYEGDTILFVARDKPMEFLQADATLGWAGYAPHLQIHSVPGDHTSLIQEPHVGELAARLRAALHEAQSAS